MKFLTTRHNSRKTTRNHEAWRGNVDLYGGRPLTTPLHRIAACLRLRVNPQGLGWGGKR